MRADRLPELMAVGEMDRNKMQVAVRLLELVVSEKMDASDALANWPDIEIEPDDLLSAAWHDLAFRY